MLYGIAFVEEQTQHKPGKSFSIPFAFLSFNALTNPSVLILSCSETPRGHQPTPTRLSESVNMPSALKGISIYAQFGRLAPKLCYTAPFGELSSLLFLVKQAVILAFLEYS